MNARARGDTGAHTVWKRCRVGVLVDLRASSFAPCSCDKCGICRVGGRENYFHCELEVQASTDITGCGQLLHMFAKVTPTRSWRWLAAMTLLIWFKASLLLRCGVHAEPKAAGLVRAGAEG